MTVRICPNCGQESRTPFSSADVGRSDEYLAAEAFAPSGRQAETEAQLAPALGFFRSARAAPYVRRAEALLGAAPRAASGGAGPSASVT